MTEQQIIENVQKLMKAYNKSMSRTARESGYLPETLSNWLRCKTRMTLDGLTAILELFGRKPAVKDKNGRYHVDIIGYLPKAIKGHEEQVYGLASCQRYGKQNFMKYVRRQSGIRLFYLIDVLDIIGEELVIVRRVKNDRTM